MERKEFIQKCCLAGAGVIIGSTFLPSCTPLHYVTSELNENKLTIPLSEFNIDSEKGNKRHKYIIVESKKLGFPICLIEEATNYSAFLMACTHQACELNIGGGQFTCPCHGSEFSMTGKVIQGPATNALKSYKTETDETNVYIYTI